MAAGGAKFYEFKADSDDWVLYVERLEQHFVANKIDDNKIRVAVLLSSISESTFSLLKSLCYPEEPKQKTFQQLCDLLKTQYTSIKSVWRERIKFYQLSQDTLSIAEWYAKVRSAAAKCNFNGNLEKTLKDKFVTGLNPGKILDRLCEEEETAPLNELYTLALKKENMANEVNFVANSSRQPVKQMNKLSGSWSRSEQKYGGKNNVNERKRNQRQEWGKWKKNENGREKCGHCGDVHQGLCRFKYVNCNVCKKKKGT